MYEPPQQDHCHWIIVRMLAVENLYDMLTMSRPSVLVRKTDGKSLSNPDIATDRQCPQFMHNGSIGEFHLIKRRLQQDLPDVAFNLVQGNTGELGFVLQVETRSSLPISQTLSGLLRFSYQWYSQIIPLSGPIRTYILSPFSFPIPTQSHSLQKR